MGNVVAEVAEIVAKVAENVLSIIQMRKSSRLGSKSKKRQVDHLRDPLAS